MTFYTLSAKLSVGSLAVPLLRARQRELVLEMRSQCTLGEVAKFLESGFGRLELRYAFNTPARLEELRQSHNWFEKVGQAWVDKQRRDSRFTWVVGYYVTGNPVEQLVATKVEPRIWRLQHESRRTPSTHLIRELEALRRMRALLADDRSANSWLRFVSMEGSQFMRQMKVPDRTLLMVLMAKGLRDLGMASCHGPWESNFPRRYRAIPVTWLYQFEPCPRVVAITKGLIRVGYTNLGHLTVLSPESWRMHKELEAHEWKLLRRLLQ